MYILGACSEFKNEVSGLVRKQKVLIQEVFTKIAKFTNKTLINQSNQMN